MIARRSSLAWVLLAACLTVFGSAQQSAAQTAQNCLEGQTRYAGTICRGMTKCYAKAFKRGTAVDPDCIPGRSSALVARFNSIEAGDNCLVEPAGSTTASMLESGVDNLHNALSTGECGSKKIAALGRQCKQMMMCYANSAAGSHPSVDPACLDEAVGKLLDVFAKVESHTICNTTGDASGLSDEVDMLTDSLWTYLRGVGTTTTSTTTTIDTSTTTTMPPSCPENGSYTPCYAYRDNPACKACVDGFANQAMTLCAGAVSPDACGNADENTACGYAINTATTCSTTCCP